MKDINDKVYRKLRKPIDSLFVPTSLTRSVVNKTNKILEIQIYDSIRSILVQSSRVIVRGAIILTVRNSQ